MQHDPRSWLWDVRQAVDSISTFVRGRKFAISMRNALIHGYREVDNATVWQTIYHDLPVLRTQVAAVLAELGEEP